MARLKITIHNSDAAQGQHRQVVLGRFGSSLIALLLTLVVIGMLVTAMIFGYLVIGMVLAALLIAVVIALIKGALQNLRR